MRRKSTEHLLKGLLIICLFGFVVNLSFHSSPFANAKSPVRHALNLSQTIDYGNSTQHTFSDLSGETVFDILNQTATVTFTQYLYGKFITAINGVENNANNSGRYWQYWVNVELAPVAAENYILSDGDQVLWKYCAPESTPTTPPPFNPEVFVGLGIIGVVGVMIVLAASIVYYKIR